MQVIRIAGMPELGTGKQGISGEDRDTVIERTASLATVILLFVFVVIVCSELDLDIADVDVRIVWRQQC